MESFLKLAAGAAVSLCCCASVVSAALVAHFDDGNGTASVDRYAGVAGNGWSTAWLPRQQNAIIQTSSTKVYNTTPLTTGGGNYLSVTAQGAGNGVSGAKTAAVNRKYDGSGTDVSLEESRRISFLFRFDSGFDNFTESTDYVYLTEQRSGGNQVYADTASSSWVIRAHGAASGSAGAKSWAFYDGDPDSNGVDSSRYEDSGVALVQGHVYRFTVETDPETFTWNGKVEDLTTPVSYSSPTLNYRSISDELTDSGGQLVFGMRYNTHGIFRTFSLDDVAVSAVPEPTALSFLAATGALGMRGRRPRSRVAG